MRRTVPRKLLDAAALSVTLLALLGCATRPSTEGVERTILDGDQAWAESLVTGDTEVLERIIANDFVGTSPRGNRYTKGELIGSTKDAPKVFASNTLGKVTVRVFGDVAVAQGEENWVKHKGEPIRGRFVWTDVWVLRNGKWQIVAAQDVIPTEVRGQ
jgi:hypothetical protein